MSPLPVSDRLSNLIATARLDVSTEASAQRDLGILFAQEGLVAEAEVILSPRDRIDFLIQDVGIEVKIGHSRRSILRQLERYALSDRIGSLLLVSSTAFPSSISSLNGKDLRVVSLATGWL